MKKKVEKWIIKSNYGKFVSSVDYHGKNKISYNWTTIPKEIFLFDERPKVKPYNSVAEKISLNQYYKVDYSTFPPTISKTIYQPFAGKSEHLYKENAIIEIIKYNRSLIEEYRSKIKILTNWNIENK